jgi:N6-adenosine-specific RNA methylase IME4
MTINERARAARDGTGLEGVVNNVRVDAAANSPTTAPAQASSIVLYDAACRALDEAHSVSEIKDIHDQTAAMQEYARRANNHELEAKCVALRMTAARRLGEMMEAQRQTVGLNRGTAGAGRPSLGGSSENPRKDLRPTLPSQGIGKNLAHQARTLWALPKDQFEQRVTEAQASAGRVVRRVVNAVTMEQKRQIYRARTYQGGKVEDLEALTASGFRAGVISIDFAWKFEAYSSKTGQQRSPDAHYDTMLRDEIVAMAPIICGLAAPNCALLSWGTWPHLLQLVDFIRDCEPFGFEYKTAGFVWVKTNSDGSLFVEEDDLATGMGLSGTRANTEYVLLAKRGSPLRLNADVHQVVMAPRPGLEHSEKPEEVARRIERLYPGPRIELFARRERPGWITWGNEVPPPPIDQPPIVEPALHAIAGGRP